MLNRFRKRFKRILETIGKALLMIGLRAWHISIIGLFLSIFAGVILIYYYSYIGIVISACIYLLSGFMDSLDGTIARLRGEVSPWGGFIDAYLDRIEEAIYIIFIQASRLNPNPILVSTYLTLSFLISYSRSKAGEYGVKIAGIGLMERAERVLFLGIGLILIPYIRNINYIFFVLVILLLYTAIERIYRVYQGIRK